MSEEQPSSLVRRLVSSLWFPMFFVVGFMACYLLPFHSPAPNHMPIAVVGEQSADQLGAALNQAMPGGFDITAVPDEQAAKESITGRDAVAAYDPSDGSMFYAKANGAALQQVLQQIFTPFAAQSGQQLTMTDLAPTAPGDVMGTGLFYCLMAMNIAPYITVMMLLSAELTTRQKLFSLAGVGAVVTGICYSTALALNVIHNEPSLLLVGFLLTQAIAWTTFGLVPYVKQFIPGVAMGLFVLLSLPSSGGAIPKELVPSFFQSLHNVLPLGNAVDSMRGILYFDGQDAMRGIIGMGGWLVVGVALVVVNEVRARRGATKEDSGGTYEHEDDSDAVVDPSFEAPAPVHHRTLSGSVIDRSGTAVQGAIVTMTDGTGLQLARVVTSRDGTYTVHDLPEQSVTVVASASGMEPAVDRLAVRSGHAAQRDFVLDARSAHSGALSAGSTTVSSHT